MEKEFPKRKHPRLKQYDYITNGYYFVTICAADMRCVFGKIQRVGRGLAPAVSTQDSYRIILSSCGRIAKQQLAAIEQRYDFVRVDRYVIMPNHIHAIFVLEGKTAGASPRPTLPDIICAYKSLTTRICNAFLETPGEKIFQTSFYESVIRSDEGYFQACQYIIENPRKWENDEYYK